MTKNEEQQFDVEGRLRMYFPIFFELLGDNKIKWKTVTKVFSKKVEEWKAKHDKTGKNIRVEASLFNLITASIQGNDHAASHLKFIQNVFEELIKNLDADEGKLVVPALYGMLTNINRKFYSFLGELCVLNNIKKNTAFKLFAVEVPVLAEQPERTKLDFHFVNHSNSKSLFIEVVNIHLNGIEEWPDVKINNLFHQKIQGKLNSTGIKHNQGFQLVPVFWGQFDELNRINKFYKDYKTNFLNTTPPLSFASFKYGDGGQIHFFGTIDSIIDKYQQSRGTKGEI
jgi:hypothetical protein